MADIEPPSFSLGLDFDFDLPCQAPDSPTKDTSATVENNNESRCPDSPPPLFRRLRRGLPAKNKEPECPFTDSIDDDIEEFSSDEFGAGYQTAPQVQSVCSGTKFSLHGRGIVTKQPTTEPCRKRKQDLDAPSTSSAQRGNPIFLDVTMSPLRKFQQIGSDSDDMSDFGDAGVRTRGIKVPNKKESNISSSAAAYGKKPPAQFSEKVDFWKNFHPEEACNVPTPALDEFCQDYFRAPKHTNAARDTMHGLCQTQGRENKRGRVGVEKLQKCDNGHALPPAHCYFFHDDLRIQRLVQSRLCHFQPLLHVYNAGNQQHNASTIDYRSQFNNESSSMQKSSTRANAKTSSRKGTTNSSEEWINPKSSAKAPKDATRRRVHASGGSVGQWVTDENGKKSYVSKTGQEFTGQSAYRCYKKESGTGFGKSKKKPAGRRKKK